MSACSGLAALPKTEREPAQASSNMSTTYGALLATLVLARTLGRSSMASNGSLSFMGALPGLVVVAIASVTRAGRPPFRAVVSAQEDPRATQAPGLGFAPRIRARGFFFQ